MVLLEEGKNKKKSIFPLELSKSGKPNSMTAAAAENRVIGL
jgi:hypothetical protein